LTDFPDFLAKSAMQYLEDVIVPIVISAARLSPATSVDEFVELSLTEYTNSQFGIHSGARLTYCQLAGLDECEELDMIGIVIIIMHLANNSRARKICRNIIELMMRDAVEFRAAEELFKSTCLVGVDNTEYRLRCSAAEKVWERWKATDQKIVLTQTEFLWNITDLRYLIAQYFSQDCH